MDEKQKVSINYEMLIYLFMSAELLLRKHPETAKDAFGTKYFPKVEKSVKDFRDLLNRG